MSATRLEGPFPAAFDPSMWEARADGYEGLHWVNEAQLLVSAVATLGLRGDETVLEIGTGTQAVLRAVRTYLPQGKLIGLDISAKMLGEKPYLKGNLAVGDSHELPFGESTVDRVIARMVFHHLSRPTEAAQEAFRVLTPGGRLLVGEHVVIDDPLVKCFEREMFDLKEPGRHLWTADELIDQVGEGWNELKLERGVVGGYSARNWMENSGLPQSVQQAVLDHIRSAPRPVIERLNIVYSADDILFDGHFAYLVATKP